MQSGFVIVFVPDEDIKAEDEKKLPCPVFPIQFPGFNAPNPENVPDKDGQIPIQERHLQEAQMPISLPPVPSRKRGLSSSGEMPASEKRFKPMDTNAETDMDVVSDTKSEPEDGEITDVEEYDPLKPSLVQTTPDELQTHNEVNPQETAEENGQIEESLTEEKTDEYCPQNNWSLDFPPGRVDLSADVKGGQWKAIKDLLKMKTKRKK
jgi:hypothetical protein